VLTACHDLQRVLADGPDGDLVRVHVRHAADHQIDLAAPQRGQQLVGQADSHAIA